MDDVDVTCRKKHTDCLPVFDFLLLIKDLKFDKIQSMDIFVLAKVFVQNGCYILK
jgi:hypothetical protein